MNLRNAFDPAQSRLPAPTLPDDLPDDVAAPIRAGLRARAIADACERLDLPAMLIDKSGRVLHAAASVGPMLGVDYLIAAGHLVGRSSEANRRVESAVTTAVGDTDAGPSAVAAAFGLTGIAVHDPSPAQLLKGLLVFVPRDPGAAERLDALRVLLRS